MPTEFIEPLPIQEDTASQSASNLGVEFETMRMLATFLTSLVWNTLMTYDDVTIFLSSNSCNLCPQQQLLSILFLYTIK
jgi:hypothetical protein